MAQVEFDQATRILAINTRLGRDKAVLTELEGEDAISKPFLFRIKFATEVSAEKVQELLGTEVTLWFGRPGEGENGVTAVDRRPLHGYFSRLIRGVRQRGKATEWQAEVVPALWFLSRTSDCRIFQEKSVPDIVKEVLDLHGVTNVRMKLVGSYDPLEYCVQYRESALDFISRLMEQSGIFYWHEHEENQHTLVIADDNGSTFAAPFECELPVSAMETTNAIRRLDEDFVVRSGKWSLRDFNFETPKLDLEVNEPTLLNVEKMQSLERYDYPGLYPNASLGKTAAQLQIEREEAFHRQLRGASSVSGLDAGMRVKIKGLEVNEKEEPEVLIIAVRHSAMDYSHWTTEAWSGREPGAPHYDNEFVCIRKSMKFRPERVTPKPFVHGPQTAIVTGLSGEEIHTDAYGRVKVQFHWDRVGRKDETSSCWVRVSQGWAGKNWGQIHIPRVGHEVIVDFLEGDPDRPIITGRVYNAENPVPYSLPEKKTQSGIKSNSTKDGDGSNEIRFEDLKGSEEIFIHAERDYNTKIENDETRVVGGKGTGNRTTTIKNDETTTIKGNKTTTVEMDFNETITGTETRKVTGDVTETYIANETRTIGGSVTETVTGSFTRTITGSVTDTITGSLTMSVVGGVTVTSPAPINLTSSVAINQTAPSLMQTTPNFYNTGATSGDAYGFVQSNSGFKIENMGAYISTIVTKMDNFGLAIANGGIEIKNKSMKAYTYTFALKTGFTLHS